jgi:hypothetical protein
MPTPKTSYAKSGDVNVAYQVLGDGPTGMREKPVSGSRGRCGEGRTAYPCGSVRG